MKPKFSPSLMCMDLLNIRSQIKAINERADFYHVDIMDGHYVKNITLSPDFVRAIRPVCTLPIDCHLMCTNPEDFVDVLAEAGADYICPHAEVINAQAFRMINRIRSLGKKVGVVLNPATPLSYIEHYIHLIDKLTIMTVDPGFAGQPFIEEMLGKIAQAKRWKEERGYSYLIEVDGSCNQKTFRSLRQAGCEVFIVGSSGLFGLSDTVEDAWDCMMDIYYQETVGLE